MAAVTKVDSNVTGLRFAEEASLKVLPGSPIWVALEPNSYDNFGGSITTISRNPISDGRQRLKGPTTDLDAAGGFNSDLTQSNLQEILQGFMYASHITKDEFGGAGEVTAVDGVAEEYEAASGLDAFAVGDLVFASGFADTANNGIKRVTAVSATALGVAEDLIADASPAAAAKLVTVGFQGAAGDIDVDSTGTYPALTSTTLDFTTLGLTVGEFIFVGGDLTAEKFTTAANNGFKRIYTIAANRLEFDKSDAALVTEASTTETIRLFFGRVLKNQTGSGIVKRSYQLERTLGAPDDALPAEIQSEYLTGAQANQATFNVAPANKVTVDLSFIALDHETRTGATGVKSGTRPTALSQDAFNTSSDFSRINMSVVTAGNEAPTPLFAFVTDLSLVINNNIGLNKAIGTLGACGVSVGTFQVSASLTAYFADVAGIQSVRDNDNVTLDFVMAKQNAGIAFDLPLVSLGDGRADIQQDQAIRLPLSADAASGVNISTSLNHTLMLVFFDYLPTAAE